MPMKAQIDSTAPQRELAMRPLALVLALSLLGGCAAAMPAVPGESTDTFFTDAAADPKSGRSMRDSAQRCRARLTELRSSASQYRLTATVLLLLSGTIGVVAGTTSAALSSDTTSNSKGFAVTAAVAAGLTAVVTPLLRPDAREQAYMASYYRWQTANVRLRSLYTSEPLTAGTPADETDVETSMTAKNAERFQQAWSAMADDLDVCASTSFR